MDRLERELEETAASMSHSVTLQVTSSTHRFLSSQLDRPLQVLEAPALSASVTALSTATTKKKQREFADLVSRSQAV